MTQPTHPDPVPPPLPRRTAPAREIGDLGAPQPVFDTVGGPNLRLRDNLIQLAAIVAAIPITFLITLAISRDVPMSLIIGILGGLIGGVLISGAALGLYRGIAGVKRMTKK